MERLLKLGHFELIIQVLKTHEVHTYLVYFFQIERYLDKQGNMFSKLKLLESTKVNSSLFGYYKDSLMSPGIKFAKEFCRNHESALTDPLR